MSPVLVTGGAGFVGRHVVAALLEAGRGVRVLDTDAEAPLPGAVERLTGSILDAALLERACAGCDAVIHAAAIAHLWTRDPADFDRVNAEGTARVMEAAAGARVVHVSSYTTLMPRGARPGTATEADEYPPDALVPHYPISKRRAELAAEAAGAVIVLPSAPVGPGDVHVTPPTAMIRDLAARRLPGMLDCRLNLVDVRALAGGILAALEKGGPGRRYLLAGADLTMDEFLAIFERVSGVRTPRARVPYWVALAAARAGEAAARLTGRLPRAPLAGVRLAGLDLRFDSARARAELGWTPPPIDDALGAALAEV